jgi:hypothetical protein
MDQSKTKLLLLNSLKKEPNVLSTNKSLELWWWEVKTSIRTNFIFTPFFHQILKLRIIINSMKWVYLNNKMIYGKESDFYIKIIRKYFNLNNTNILIIFGSHIFKVNFPAHLVLQCFRLLLIHFQTRLKEISGYHLSKIIKFLVVMLKQN